MRAFLENWREEGGEDRAVAAENQPEDQELRPLLAFGSEVYQGFGNTARCARPFMVALGMGREWSVGTSCFVPCSLFSVLRKRDTLERSPCRPTVSP